MSYDHPKPSSSLFSSKRPTAEKQAEMPPAPPPKPDQVVLHIHRIELSDNRGYIVDLKFLYEIPAAIRSRRDATTSAFIIGFLILVICVLLVGR